MVTISVYVRGGIIDRRHLTRRHCIIASYYKLFIFCFDLLLTNILFYRFMSDAFIFETLTCYRI